MMRGTWVTLLLLSALLSGCTDGTQDDVDDDQFSDYELEHSQTTGVVRGVVIDEAIRPIAGVTVRLLADTPLETQSDEEGRFGFSNVPPGTYDLEAELRNYAPALVQTEVVAGLTSPPVVKIQLTRLFSQSPYAELFQMRGFLNCGYDIVGISSTCINDYTRIDPTGSGPCPGGCFPQIANNLNLDRREYFLPVANGWQTIVFEMDWQPSASGTSERMGITVSHSQRDASHWYDSKGSTAPLRLEMVVGQDGANGQGEPTQIPPEGIPDMQVLTNVDAGSPGIAVALQQDYEIIQTTFVWGLPPEGWSFVAGDDLPF